MSDSLISGQPLYLLNSKSRPVLLASLALDSLAILATGKREVAGDGQAAHL